MKTCDGSRTELQAVKPAMSANITVHSGNRSAMGDLSPLSLVAFACPERRNEPSRALGGRNIWLAGSASRTRSRTVEGKRDLIIAFDLAAAPRLHKQDMRLTLSVGATFLVWPMLTALYDFLVLEFDNIVIQSEMCRSEQEHDQGGTCKDYGIRCLIGFLSTFGRKER